MKIALLGATGPSGLQVVKEALARGHTVTALVRNPEKLTEKHEKLKVVKANIYNADDMAPHFEGQDAVLSCLGTTPSWFSLWTITFYTDTAKPIVEALRKANVTRLVFMTSWYTKYDRSDPFIINWVLKPLFLGPTLHNMGQMEDYFDQECADIAYTSVRPPQLVDTDTSGKPVLAEVAQSIRSPGKRFVCCRRDVARFMLDAAEKREYIRKCVAIASG
ncbi:flavin reductase (NADPH)-like [Dreissena polymorpha]|uniref:NAD(P)-binding domain-containing protein n=1 Tax=Dreissena polymorpha TaxID=45954 RepID=A0A9D4FWD1_DREPO|nr:flavin reductase (NADPH)-like [Dreissena polymorpha]KAH3805662.1 hypothetical protein DPMN_133968 [Dreissena polymorpha]